MTRAAFFSESRLLVICFAVSRCCNLAAVTCHFNKQHELRFCKRELWNTAPVVFSHLKIWCILGTIGQHYHEFFVIDTLAHVVVFCFVFQPLLWMLLFLLGLFLRIPISVFLFQQMPQQCGTKSFILAKFVFIFQRQLAASELFCHVLSLSEWCLVPSFYAWAHL